MVGFSKSDIIRIIHAKKDSVFEFRNKTHSKCPLLSSILVEPAYHVLKSLYKLFRSGHKVKMISGEASGGDFCIRQANSPMVSVIVPNYNHGRYLHQRLDSIVNQKFRDFEILLLDDCSTDGSREILCEYAERYPHLIRKFYNDENSGNIFKQWKKGIENARGELIWVAESDDFCELDFLSKLVGFFNDETVRLAYAYPEFVDKNSRVMVGAADRYISRTNGQKWKKPYVKNSCDEVANTLGVINSIPNASCCVFRKPKDLSIFDASAKFRLCGDWAFYLNYLSGWKVAFTPKTRSYFRMHQGGLTSQMTATKEYFKEHCEIFKIIRKNYRPGKQHLKRFKEQLYYVNLYSSKGVAKEYIDSLFSGLSNYEKKGQLSVLIASMGFYVGGGEIQPIRLANALKKVGCNVTFFSMDGMPRDPMMRRRLRADIPVYCPDTIKGKHLDTFLKNSRIDVINTHGPYTEFYFSKYLKNSKMPIVATMHGGYESYLGDMEFNYLGRVEFMRQLELAKKRIDRWIYISENNLEHFEDEYAFDRSKFVKMTNGFDIDDANVQKISRKSMGIAEDSFVCICCSRAIEKKGWREAIQIVTQLREKINRDVDLVLLGAGGLFEKLSAEPLPSFVHLIGYKENVLDYMAAADAMLFPTYFKGESVPLSIIEAMALGKPVIATRVGQIETMLAADTDRPAGIVTALNSEGKPDIELLTKALGSVVTDNGLYERLAANVPERFSQFDMGRCAEQYLMCFKEAAGQVVSELNIEK